jgi:hypothetical protein
MLTGMKHTREHALVGPSTTLEYRLLTGDATAKWHCPVNAERETDHPIFTQRSIPEEDSEVWIQVDGKRVLCTKVSPVGQQRTFERCGTDARNSFIAQSLANQVRSALQHTG